MNNSTKFRAIITHLSPKISRIASRIVPYNEFLQYAHAVLEDTCRSCVDTQPHLDVENIQDIVLEQTAAKIETAGRYLLDVLQSGTAQGRVTLFYNDKPFLIDLHPETE